MNNPFYYTPDAACERAFQELSARLESLKMSDNPSDINFCRELEAGKMLGVLVAVDDAGTRHTLYAFSGQLGHGGFHHEGFVGPVFDYLDPEGFFKRNEALISQQNSEIARFENGPFAMITEEYERNKRLMEGEIAEYKEHCRRSKLARKARRESRAADEAELAALLRQSQFEKAELHRLRKRLAAELEPVETRLKEAQSRLDAMKERRRSDSEALQKWLFTNFRLLNARGEIKSLSDIFADTAMKTPPSGAGECCAPKLLNAAYLRGLHPVAMAEYWYGQSKEGEVRIHGEHYPACRGKCLPVLGWMLEGLSIEPPLDSDSQPAGGIPPEIIYENEWFCVVNKPCGMLSVPGKGSGASVQQWLAERYGIERKVKVAHRLDRDTSGLLLAAFGEDSFKAMQALFASRKVKKTYVADLEGDFNTRSLPTHGRIMLPLSPDWLDRPRQRVDITDGKEAITEYEFTGSDNGRSHVRFYPLTGRTHQLRVHAASSLGLGMPIVGDPLYGRNTAGQASDSHDNASDRHDKTCDSHNTGFADRLHLHAMRIEFTFPPDKHHYIFDSPAPF